MIHIAAMSQIRLGTDGRVCYRRKRAEGKKSLEAIRCLKPRISDAIYRQLLEDAQRAAGDLGTGPGGQCGATLQSSAVDCTRTSTLRISHFPDPRKDATPNRLTTEGSRKDAGTFVPIADAEPVTLRVTIVFWSRSA